MKFKLIAITIIALAALATQALAQCSCCSGSKKPQTVGLVKYANGTQKATVVIDGGYTPSTIKAKVGKPLVITFIRKETSGCGGQIVFKSLGITKNVANGAKVTVKFTPKKPGVIAFTCGMNMYKGQIVVK